MKALNAVLLCGGLITGLALSPAAQAQTDTSVLRGQIELLKGNFDSLSKQFQDLQQYVYLKGGGEAGAKRGPRPADASPGVTCPTPLSTFRLTL